MAQSRIGLLARHPFKDRALAGTLISYQTDFHANLLPSDNE
jgi:hypothetical protein